MITAFFLVCLLFALMAVRRRNKRRLVAGLVSERPAFHVTPPPGRLGHLKDGAL